MSLKIGIVGLPNVGKSTLFNALTRSRGAQAANYPFCTIDPNVGVVEVPDTRLQNISGIVSPEKVIPTAIEFVDIAGLVKGASQGEGLGNKFLHHIREVDAICHLVRGFGGGDIIHVDGSIDAARDKGVIETELALADLESVQKQAEKLAGAARTGNKEKQAELDLIKRIESALEEGKKASSVDVTEDEHEIAKQFNLLTYKPFIYGLNVAEDEIATISSEDARKQLELEASDTVITLSAKIEEDLQDLDSEESAAYLADLGVDSSGLDRLVHAAYEALGLDTFFTAGPQEVRAWTVKKGASAPQAAGVIHTDFERGFICADTIGYDDFVTHNGEKGAKDAGKLRQEGKQYIVNDGDVFHFKFNV